MGAVSERRKRRRKIRVLLLLITMLLAGCGEHECAICGNPADTLMEISGKHVYICDECYRDYIEIQHLFSETLD